MTDHRDDYLDVWEAAIETQLMEHDPQEWLDWIEDNELEKRDRKTERGDDQPSSERAA